MKKVVISAILAITAAACAVWLIVSSLNSDEKVLISYVNKKNPNPDIRTVDSSVIYDDIFLPKYTDESEGTFEDYGLDEDFEDYESKENVYETKSLKVVAISPVENSANDYDYMKYSIKSMIDMPVTSMQEYNMYIAYTMQNKAGEEIVRYGTQRAYSCKTFMGVKYIIA